MKAIFQNSFPFAEKQQPTVSPIGIDPIFPDEKEPIPNKPKINAELLKLYPNSKIIPKLENLKIRIINQDQIKMESEKMGTFANGVIFPGEWNCKPVILRKYDFSQINEELEKKLIIEFTKFQNVKFPKFNTFYGVFLQKETEFLFSVHEFAKAFLSEKLKAKLPKLTHKEKNSIIMQIIEILYFQSKKQISHEKIELNNFLITENGQVQWFDLGFNNNNNKIEKNDDFNEIWFLGLMIYEIYMEEPLWNESQMNEIVRKFKKENSEPEIKKYDGENAEIINVIIRGCLKFKKTERMNIDEVTKKFSRKI